MSWVPPRGSVEVEAGYWQAPNGDIYQSDESTAATFAQRDADNKARAREDRDARVRERPQITAGLLEKTQALEAQLWFLGELFLVQQQLLVEAREALLFEEGLVASLLVEARPRVRHLRRAA